jgi:hypothetical protein
MIVKLGGIGFQRKAAHRRRNERFVLRELTRKNSQSGTRKYRNGARLRVHEAQPV